MEAAELAFDDVTDWYIPEADDQGFLVYPGAVMAEGVVLRHAKALQEQIVWRQGQEDDRLKDWRLEYQGAHFRVHRQRTVNGTMYMLRRISTQLPDIKRLGMPAELAALLVRASFGEHGGLVILSGGPGHGKSTTCASVLLERVRTFGYFGLTVEDPPEFPLHGNHEAENGCIGKIVQVPAESDSFAADLRDALRCYPSNMRGSMLMVGEVRDSDTAAQLLRSAVNGQLVFATIHASDAVGALERLLALAKEVMGAEEAKSLLSHSLRAVLHQRLQHKRLFVDPLISLTQHTSVAGRIKSGQLAQLSTDIQLQATWLRHGRLIENLGPNPPRKSQL